MKCTFDTDALKDNNVSLQEAFLLLAICNKERVMPTEDVLNDMWNKGLLLKDVATDLNPTGYTMNIGGAQKLSDILIDSEYQNEKTKNKRFEALAEKLRDLYPEGRKEGTNYYWRDSVKVIARKLKALDKKFGSNFSDEDAINATKRYIESFNGNYTYMQLLKYFIMKNTIKNGEVEENSQLLSYIENKDQINDTNSDWTAQIR